MATSGSYNFSRTADQIIQSAYEDIGIVAEGGSVSSAQSTLALARLNMIAKQWQGTADFAPGLKIWSRRRVVLFLAKGQQKYVVGPGSSDARATTSYGRTTVSSAYASGTSLSVTALTDTTTDPGTTVTMTASDLIGVELDDGTLSWTTISSAASSPITLGGALGGAAAAGNYVWWFTSRAQRFVSVESAVLRNDDLNEVPLYVYRDAREYDQGIADKYADGTPTEILVEPLFTQTRVTLNSQPTDVTDQIVMTVLYPSEDYDATTDDIAFPQEWYGALHWELASWLCIPFARPWTAEMDQKRKESLTIARNLNPEMSMAYFQCGGN